MEKIYLTNFKKNLEKTMHKIDSIENIGKEHFAGSFKVQVVISPEQPRVGKNQVTLIVRDENDKPG